MADEGILFPGDLAAHVAPGFIGVEIGVLIVVGVLTPQHDGVIRLGLFRPPLGHIGHIARNGDFPLEGTRFCVILILPAEERIARTRGLRNITHFKGRAVLGIDRLRAIDTAVHVKGHGVILAVVINLDHGGAVGCNDGLGNALAAEAGLVLGDRFGIRIDVTGQLHNRWVKGILVILQILIIVLDRVL